MSKDTQILKPVEVGEIRSLPKGKSEKLIGFVLPVTYDGVANCNKNRLLKMGVLDAGYGSTWQSICVENDKTVVNYLFREGILFPEPFARAKKFRNDVLEIINGFNPVRVSGIETQYALDLFDDFYVAGHAVTVSYPGSLLKNQCFKKLLLHDKAKIAVSNQDFLIKVKYSFPNKKNANAALSWQCAEEFRKNMLARMKNENTK